MVDADAQAFGPGEDYEGREAVAKQPAYGGEAEAARLRRHGYPVAFGPSVLAGGTIVGAVVSGPCEHPATIIARVCASCEEIMAMENG